MMKILLPAQRPVEWALELTLMDSLGRPVLGAGDGFLVLKVTTNLEPTDVIYQRHYGTVSVQQGFEGYVEYLSVIVYRIWLAILFGSSTGVMGFPNMRPVQSGLVKDTEKAATPSSSHSQKHPDSIFDIVPPPSRMRLVKRLGEYVSNERRRQYEKLYELLYGHKGEKKLNKQAYVASRQLDEGERGVLEEFTPVSVIDLTRGRDNPLTFSIKGRAKLFCKGQTVIKTMIVHAKFQDGDWYFAEVSDSYKHID